MPIFELLPGQSEGDQTGVQVRLEDKTVWLSQNQQRAALFLSEFDRRTKRIRNPGMARISKQRHGE